MSFEPPRSLELKYTPAGRVGLRGMSRPRSRTDSRSEARDETSSTAADVCGSGQGKHRKLPAERRIVAQSGVSAHSTEAGGGIRQTRSEADAGPAADAREDRDILLAAMVIGHHIADDARRRLELVEFLAGLGVDGFEITLQRSVEHDPARRRPGGRHPPE